MASTTPRMGIKTWDDSDPFLRLDFNNNSEILDNYPGHFICTSASRPAWGANQAGMRIYETDTRQEVEWSGSQWREVMHAPPVWSGYVNPDVALGKDTHVFYQLASINVKRPGALLLILSVQAQVQSVYTANINIRPQVDGNDCHIGDNAAHMRAEQVHTSGAGWSRHYQIPSLGLRTVQPGDHTFGIHFYTSPTGTTSTVSVRFVSCRAAAILVNSTDT